MTSRLRRASAAGLSAVALVLASAAAFAQDDGQDEAPDNGEALPAGHPHGGDATGSTGLFQAKPDTSNDDPSLPAGSIAVEIRDADDKPMPGVEVTLGILQQSIAKGESRRHVEATTDAAGRVAFHDLEKGSQVAYRVSVARDAATFGAMPFRLPLDKGERVVLHVYPVTHDIEGALIVMQAALFVELKDDRIQMQELLNVYNFGKTTWVPNDLVLPLPETFTALNGSQQMSDQGVDAVEKRGARLHGTFGPGRSAVEFRWQLPYAGEREVDFTAGMPPHLAAAKVLVSAADPMKVHVDGFPEPMATTDPQAGRVFETQREARREDAPIKGLHVELRDIPVAGPGRIVATCLAALGVMLGLAYAATSKRRDGAARGPRTKEQAKLDRKALLLELEELERAHRAGEVGPKTYERARREIIDAIARTLAPSRA